MRKSPLIPVLILLVYRWFPSSVKLFSSLSFQANPSLKTIKARRYSNARGITARGIHFDAPSCFFGIASEFLYLEPPSKQRLDLQDNLWFPLDLDSTCGFPWKTTRGNGREGKILPKAGATERCTEVNIE